MSELTDPTYPTVWGRYNFVQWTLRPSSRMKVFECVDTGRQFSINNTHLNRPLRERTPEALHKQHEKVLKEVLA